MQLSLQVFGGVPQGECFGASWPKNCAKFTSSFHSHMSLSLLVSLACNNVHIKPFPLVCLFWDLTLNRSLITREKWISNRHSLCLLVSMHVFPFIMPHGLLLLYLTVLRYNLFRPLQSFIVYTRSLPMCPKSISIFTHWLVVVVSVDGCPARPCNSRCLYSWRTLFIGFIHGFNSSIMPNSSFPLSPCIYQNTSLRQASSIHAG